nr:MAG TPA: hypothetical protein [Caudoviricetes sp.]
MYICYLVKGSDSNLQVLGKDDFKRKLTPMVVQAHSSPPSYDNIVSVVNI